MPRIVREADIEWEGTTARGSGVVSATSSGSFELPSTLASRVELVQGKTSPEELLAAAHATCWVTSLGSELARLGSPPERMHVRCTITMDEVEGQGHLIVHSALDVRARVDGLDAESFAKAVEDAHAGCSFSSLLRAAGVGIDIETTLEEGDD